MDIAMKAPKPGLSSRAKSLSELAGAVSRQLSHAKNTDSSAVQVEHLDEAIRDLEKVAPTAETLLADLIRYRGIIQQAVDEGL